jgi:hypothetical protein
MCEVVSLSKYKKSLEKKQTQIELDFLYQQVDEIMEKIGEIEPEPFYNNDEIVDGLLKNGLQLGPSESALFSAYYSLIGEGREDLAELVLGILEMK